MKRFSRRWILSIGSLASLSLIIARTHAKSLAKICRVTPRQVLGPFYAEKWQSNNSWQADLTKVENSKKRLIEKINKIKSKNEKIYGYGATSKSTTILNYCKLGPKIIDHIYDTTFDKINKLSPGMHIPIKNYKYFKNSHHKNVFLFAWNHKKEILKKEKSKKIKWLTHL